MMFAFFHGLLSTCASFHNLPLKFAFFPWIFWQNLLFLMILWHNSCFLAIFWLNLHFSTILWWKSWSFSDVLIKLMFFPLSYCKTGNFLFAMINEINFFRDHLSKFAIFFYVQILRLMSEFVKFSEPMLKYQKIRNRITPVLGILCLELSLLPDVAEKILRDKYLRIYLYLSDFDIRDEFFFSGIGVAFSF